MNKNILISLAMASILTLVLTACSAPKQAGDALIASTAAATQPPEPDVGALSTDAPADVGVPLNTDEAQTAFGLNVKSEDCFYNYGYASFVCPDDGDYSFDMQSGDTEVQWSVYVLDGEFTDALRYLSQAHIPVISASGAIPIKAGQYVYIFCSVNSNSASEPAYGASVTVGRA